MSRIAIFFLFSFLCTTCFAQKLRDKGKLLGTFTYQNDKKDGTADIKEEAIVDIGPEDMDVYPGEKERVSKRQRKFAIASLENVDENSDSIRNFNISLGYRNSSCIKKSKSNFKNFAYVTRFFVASHDTTRLLLHVKSYDGENIFSNSEKMTVYISRIDIPTTENIVLPAGDLSNTPVITEVTTKTTTNVVTTSVVKTETLQIPPTAPAAAGAGAAQTNITIDFKGTGRKISDANVYKLIGMLRTPGWYELKIQFPDEANLDATKGKFEGEFELIITSYK